MQIALLGFTRLGSAFTPNPFLMLPLRVGMTRLRPAPRSRLSQVHRAEETDNLGPREDLGSRSNSSQHMERYGEIVLRPTHGTFP